MTKGIKEKDIRDFEKHARKLGEVIKRIREYKDNAHIYVTPQQFNLMADEMSGHHGRIESKEEDTVVTYVLCSFVECGDW
jgi:hypothetical protein